MEEPAQHSRSFTLDEVKNEFIYDLNGQKVAREKWRGVGRIYPHPHYRYMAFFNFVDRYRRHFEVDQVALQCGFLPAEGGWQSESGVMISYDDGPESSFRVDVPEKVTTEVAEDFNTVYLATILREVDATLDGSDKKDCPYALVGPCAGR